MGDEQPSKLQPGTNLNNLMTALMTQGDPGDNITLAYEQGRYNPWPTKVEYIPGVDTSMYYPLKIPVSLLDTNKSTRGGGAVRFDPKNLQPNDRLRVRQIPLRIKFSGGELPYVVQVI
ncbi:MAG: hypothetical protein ACE5DX_01810 [Candidatus Dojkabacteria bacterium]